MPISAVHAATVTFTPTNVNRLVGPTTHAQSGANLSGFSTFKDASPEYMTTLVYTDFAAKLAASSLGTLSAGQSYQINSAVLTVGTSVNPYISDGSKESHLVLVTYDPTTVTWNSFTGSSATTTAGVAGTDYAAANLATGTLNPGVSVSWDFTAAAQGFLNNPAANKGIYFNGFGSITSPLANEGTDLGDVSWTVDAIKVSAVSAPIDLKETGKVESYSTDIELK
jgi:hypothetical protein